MKSRNSTILNLTLNTTGFAKGNYTISANATIVPGETETTDNTYVDGTVKISIPGDITEPFGLVDIFDLVTMAIIYGSKRGAPEYVPNRDLNCDGIIDIFDITIVAIHYGEIDP